MSHHPSFKVAIPARFASTRLPGKPLLDIAGKPMLQHVYERALDCGAEEVVIATDDARIQAAAQAFGAEVCMTSAEHRSGTERLAEVAAQRGWAADAMVVNVQGDEPLLPPDLITQVAANLAQHKAAGCATLCARITDAASLFDPNVVKVVMDARGFALYFSRATIPWDRDAFARDRDRLPPLGAHYRHIGLYAYRVDLLQRYAGLVTCPLEQAESLEQLRLLWHGERIHVDEACVLPGPGVDTAEDLEHVRTMLDDPV